MPFKRFGLRQKRSEKKTSLSNPQQYQEDNGGSRELSPSVQSQPSTSSLKKSADGSNPLGLNVVYSPQHGHNADIVFVHGLGGTSRWTWSKNRDENLFWPQTFLPHEPDLCSTRILSFGYNAKFHKRGNASTAVLDFAKALLFDLKYALDEQSRNLNIGAVPLLFVVHSMGGLVTKQAYIIGQNDPQYDNIVKAISAIIFLATPHRGSNLAVVLNRILEATLINNSKVYVSELSAESLTLRNLNEQFRHIAQRLNIISFYETQPTPIIGTRAMVVGKNSSILGYPGEISNPLDGDHHGVCKFESRRDPNYIKVRNALMATVSKIVSTNSPVGKEIATSDKSLYDVRSALGLSELPDVDYIFFQDQWTNGISSWLLKDDGFDGWLNSPGHSVLFIHGGAATGKSVLASFIIDHLVKLGVRCQYFFIRVSNREKRTLSLLLRSIAYQITLSFPELGLRLAELANQGVDFGDPRMLWERWFKSVLFKMKEMKTLYWVIDGLDEADDFRSIIKRMSDIQLSSTPIRVILLGKATSEITPELMKLPKSLYQGTIKIEGHVEDLYTYINRELSMVSSPKFSEDIIQKIVADAQNNFLWVRLVVEKLNTCHTLEDVSDALQRFPPGMEALYDRMVLSIANSPSHTARYLACKILQCIACSFRILTISELSQALHGQLSGMLELERSIVDLCGGFVVVDNSGYLAMIHHSAREYLFSEGKRPISVDRSDAHEQMLLSCMDCLTTAGLRGKLHRLQKLEFLDYSACFWSSHLLLMPSASQPVYKAIRKFLTGTWVLTWIHLLAATNKMHILTRASKHLFKYAAMRRAIQTSEIGTPNQVPEWQLFEQWATDFIKIPGQFGHTIRHNPEAIYKTIPPFCPANSAIFQQFGKSESYLLKVSGLSNPDWDESIARLSFGSNASSVLAAGEKVAVSTKKGSVFLYSSSDFEELNIGPIEHKEYMYRMALNDAGTQLVTYGYKTTKIWETTTGRCILNVDNLKSRPRPLEITFTDLDRSLLVGFDDRTIRQLHLRESDPTWQVVAGLEEEELEGCLLNSANDMALSTDGALAAVAYRGHPLSAWEVDGPMLINHCWRTREERSRGEVLEVVWHPYNPELLGLYIEGVVFKWNPYEGAPEEMQANAARLAMSKDGHLFATGDVRGTVKLYTMSDFQLLFQLSSQDAVLNVAFGPSLHRFYDIRGLYGNAWEPSALMRYSESLDTLPDSDAVLNSLDMSSTPSTALATRIDSITAIAASPLGNLYCVGTQLGAVRLYDKEKGFLADLHDSAGFHGIEQLAWSSDGRHICFSNYSRYITVISIVRQTAEAYSVAAETVLTMSMGKITGPINQLLFHTDGTQLLVSSPSSACIICIAECSVTHSLEWGSNGPKWTVHPSDGTLVAFESASISIWDWSFTSSQSYLVEYPVGEDLPSPTSEVPTDQARVIDRVLATPDKRHFLVQISLEKAPKGPKYLFSFPITSFSHDTGTSLSATNKGTLDTTVRLNPVALPQEVTSHVASILSFISYNRLIFLSKIFGICSWKHPFNKSAPPPSKDVSANKLIAREQTMPGHRQDAFDTLFMLPGDWRGKDASSLCTVWKKERSLLCPRNGEVAVVTAARLG
ncbi:hypothetical protein BDV19DRAFT_356859 [Aspergillus venezuelensis]